MARPRGEKKIHFTRWDRGAVQFAAFSAGTSAVTFVTTGTQPATIMRIRGHLLAFLDTTQAPGTLIQIGIGLIVMPEGQSTTVVSSPITDDNAPWMWYESFALGYEEMVTDVIDVPTAAAIRIPIDNKAMRILRPDRELQLVVENATLGNAGSVNIVFTGSVLFGEG